MPPRGGSSAPPRPLRETPPAAADPPRAVFVVVLGTTTSASRSPRCSCTASHGIRTMSENAGHLPILCIRPVLYRPLDDVFSLHQCCGNNRQKLKVSTSLNDVAVPPTPSLLYEIRTADMRRLLLGTTAFVAVGF